MNGPLQAAACARLEQVAGEVEALRQLPAATTSLADLAAAYGRIRQQYREEYVMYGLAQAALAQALPRMQVRARVSAKEVPAVLHRLCVRRSDCLPLAACQCARCEGLLSCTSQWSGLHVDVIWGACVTPPLPAFRRRSCAAGTH